MRLYKVDFKANDGKIHYAIYGAHNKKEALECYIENGLSFPVVKIHRLSPEEANLIYQLNSEEE